MNFLNLIIPLLLIFIFMIYIKKQRTEVSLVRSSVDGQEYVVQNKPDKQRAADTLAKIKGNLVRLVDHCKSSYPKDERVGRISVKFDPNAIAEGDDDARYTTYTLNKGEKMVFCLRTRDYNDHVHDVNLLTFVAVHELAHIASKSIGHTAEFNKNFQFLIQEAVKAGIYTPVDYRRDPKPYCGIEVTDTPLGQEYFN
jgi:hypothetical protein